MRFKYLLMVLALQFFACTDTIDSPIPNIPVNLQIDLRNPRYLSLQTIGGVLMLEGGYRGIIVYHKNINEYAAYDRACAYQTTDTCAYVKTDSAMSSVGCKCCASRYQLYDGVPIKGPANSGLRTYQTSISNDYLLIYN
jgi:nitrite reductase/ring-hydroxylating ferredoxin subunit